MAGSRFQIGDGGAPVSNQGNTVRKRWRLFLRLTAAAYGVKKWRMFLRLTVMLWLDFFSVFALYVMVNYLTNVWNLSITHAAGIVNIFMGAIPALVILFAFLADAFLGDFYTLVISSIAYSLGLVLLSLSTPPFFGPCSQYKEECIGHTQKVLFFTSLPFIGVGMVGHKVSSASFIYLQDPAPAPAPAQAPAEDAAQAEFGHISVFIIMVLILIGGGTALPYIKAWSIRFGVPAICSSTATVMFLSGSPWYKRRKAEGSPLTIALRVFVAAATKDFQQVTNFKHIYNDDHTQATSSLRWLDKAAIKFPDQAMSKSWTLCTVHEVEDTKTGIRMVPMLLTFIGTGVVLSLGTTYFLVQADHMDRSFGHIKIQLQMFLCFFAISRQTSQFFCILLEKYMPRKYFSPIGMAIGNVLFVLCCITAAIVETQRLRRHESMSVFLLLPQFVLLGAADGITNFSVKCFCRGQVPESMRHKYLVHFPKFALGIGSFASVLWAYFVGKVSERNNNPNWFQHTLNKSRLDRYYWTLTGLSAVNLVIYAIVASFYNYKESPLDDDELEGE